MINLLSLTGLLFSMTIGSSSHLMTVREVNYADTASGQTSFKVFKECLSGTCEVSDPDDIKIGLFTENSTDYRYSAVFRLGIPSLNKSYISSLNFSLAKKSGYVSYLKCDYSLNYDFSMAVPSGTWQSLPDFSLQGNNVAGSVLSSLSSVTLTSNTVVHLRVYLPDSSYSSATFFGNASSASNCPRFSILTSQGPSSNTYGAATPCTTLIITQEHNGSVYCPNCYGYAVDSLQYLSLGHLSLPSATNANLESDWSDAILNDMLARLNVYARRIDAKNSAIYPFERRIAFKTILGTNDFHFMRETSNGLWAQKGSNGNPSEVLPSTFDPDSTWVYYFHTYDSNTLYFAITPMGGNNLYYAF